jgi:hypothetical protein
VASPPAAPSGQEPPTRSSRYATLRATASGSAAPPLARASGTPPVADDEPSVDDADVEDSGQVGPSVVAQLLGGKVIEERNE